VNELSAITPEADGAAIVQTVFSVPGMRCAGCISKLEGNLPGSPGIVGARVNFTASGCR